MLSKKYFIIIGGLIFGILASTLTKLGNPLNMGLCIACFYRDIAGSIGLHNVSAVQYLRPEILGIILGSFLTSMFLKEFRPRGGSSTIIRFFLGLFMVVGALVFLGCPTRDIIRLAGGDLNALIGLFGLITGILIGLTFIKKGFNLGRSNRLPNITGWAIPLLMIFFVILYIFKPVFLHFSLKGAGAMHAPFIVSIFAGLIIGYIGQRSRMCFAGAWRDIFLVRDFYLFSGVASFFVGLLLANLFYGYFQSGLYHVGFTNQPAAHMNHLWNFGGLLLVGLCATLLGGCPFRQTILSGEGDSDAGITVLGMITGASISHNFLLASSGKGVSSYGPIAVIIGVIFCIFIGFIFIEENK
ncbi:MAG: YedE family putative selenium transporter [Deferribacterota bacterium]|nr:YedE family putative selenium transporter [Deferribacterota bacterium]